MKNTKIGFLGFGNMAQAMAKGLLRKEVIAPSQFFACAKNYDKLSKTAENMGINPCKNAEEVVLASDIVVVAVKPYLVADVLKPVASLLTGKIVFSVAAGLSYDDFEEMIPNTHHFGCIPNTPVSVCEGIYICESRHSLSDEEYKLLHEIFSPTGMMLSLEGRPLSAASTLAGCGPAFAAMFMEALADGAVKNGLPRQQAYQLASQMLAGTAKLQLESGEHPAAMKDAVCSPGGQTIRGVAALERGGFRAAVINAIDDIEAAK